MKRSKFSLSHYKLLTLNMGELIPITWYESLPGDSIQQSTSALIRVSPLLAPVMHPVTVRIHHWFVPLRLIWDDFEDFITGGDDGLDATTPPYHDRATVNEGSLMDYLGIPPGTYSPDIKYSMLPARAYGLIWNEYYRDKDLSSELTISTANGDDGTTNQNVKNVCWSKDYFTTCRPWEQKGANVTIPLEGEAAVTGIGNSAQTYPSSSTAVYETDGSGTVTYADGQVFASGNWIGEEDPSNAGYPNIRADLSTNSGIDINDLRLSLAMQRFQERSARFGSDYVEYLRSLGIRGADGRMHRPVYLGGGRQTIQFSEVLSTDSGGSDPVGDMKGHGISAMRTPRYRKFFEEHGIIMTLMSVLPKPVYGQGLHRSFSRTVKEEYYQRELQHIGDQQVYNKELYYDHTSPEDVFGYQARYDEYRSLPSGIAGEFRSTLDHWHYGRIFASDPALNSTFVEATPTKRVNASSTTDCLYVMANHSIQARRLLTSKAMNKTF